MGDNGAMPSARATHEPSRKRLGLTVGIAIALSGCGPQANAWLCKSVSGEQFKADGKWNPYIHDVIDRDGQLRIAHKTDGCVPLIAKATNQDKTHDD